MEENTLPRSLGPQGSHSVAHRGKDMIPGMRYLSLCPPPCRPGLLADPSQAWRVGEGKLC